MKHRISFVWIVALAALLLPRPSFAAFHLMEIEQVIGGVNGDTTAQAVQIRFRAGGQNLVGGNARLVVRDATGANPVTLIAFTAPNPTNNAACARILSSTAAFNSKTTPVAVPDYTMAAIPAAYLAAGSLTFEGVAGSVVLWRVSWGGAGFTGPQTVDLTNDGDGTTSPAFGGARRQAAPVAALHPGLRDPQLEHRRPVRAQRGTGPVFSNNNVTPTAFTVGLRRFRLPGRRAAAAGPAGRGARVRDPAPAQRIAERPQEISQSIDARVR
jgi:hypothetical protein